MTTTIGDILSNIVLFIAVVLILVPLILIDCVREKMDRCIKKVLDHRVIK